MQSIYLNISDRDEEHSRLPRWILSLNNKLAAHHPSTCHIILEWSTRTDGKWVGRANLNRTIPLDLSLEEIDDLIRKTSRLREEFPTECLGNEQVHTHGGNSPTRSNHDSVICRSISMVVGGSHQHTIYLRKGSPISDDTQSFEGGDEHYLLLPVGESFGRVLKWTYGDNFGLQLKVFEHDLELMNHHVISSGNPDPVKYLKRWIILNNIGPPINRLEGV